VFKSPKPVVTELRLESFDSPAQRAHASQSKTEQHNRRAAVRRRNRAGEGCLIGTTRALQRSEADGRNERERERVATTAFVLQRQQIGIGTGIGDSSHVCASGGIQSATSARLLDVNPSQDRREGIHAVMDHKGARSANRRRADASRSRDRANAEGSGDFTQISVG